VEAKHQKINILPPNINYSHWFYKATKKGIYLSIGAIKGVGYQVLIRLGIRRVKSKKSL
jgi:DNA polymerase-3 subunit alpha